MNHRLMMQQTIARKGKMMSSRTLRMSGWLLLIAAAISLVSTVLGIVIPGPAGPNGPPPNIVNIINLVAGILFLVSLPAAYIVQKKQVGILGLIGIIAIWLTALLFDIVLSIITFVLTSGAPPSASTAGGPPPFLFTLFIVGTVLVLIGGVLFGLKTIQARVFPAAIGWLLIVAAILNAVDFPLQGTISTIVSTASSVLLFVALGWLGYLITTRAAEAVIEPAMRRASV
jgi:hypothetical protein